MPKRREIDFIVSATPAQIDAHLKTITRYSPLPHRSSLLGKGNLQGSHNEAGFKVADDTRGYFQTLRPVANCTIEARAQGGTRIHGVVGLPQWVTWAMRLSTLLIPIILGVAAWQMVAGGGAAVFFGPLGLALFLMIAVFSVGRLIANADDGVDPLVERLQTELAVQKGPATVVERQRQPQRQTE